MLAKIIVSGIFMSIAIYFSISGIAKFVFAICAKKSFNITLEIIFSSSAWAVFYVISSLPL